MRRRWTVGLGVFFGVGLLWLLPTMLIQARAPEAQGDLLAYPRLLLMQWRWRLDQPKAFIGAEGPAGGESMWLYRADHHVLGLLTRGFGFELNTVRGWFGLAMLVSGWVFYALRDRVRWLLPPLDDEGPRRFWRQHLPWAVVYYLTIFCFLPGDQRYYLPIFPLLILPAVLGWQSVTVGNGWLAVAVPAVTLLATLPFIGPNHNEPAPPVQMARWLEGRHSPAERFRILLILNDDWRHAGWYAPEFISLWSQELQKQAQSQMFSGGKVRPHLHEIPWRMPSGIETEWPRPPHPSDVHGWAAVYTDDPDIIKQFDPAGWQLVQTFQRSPLIYRKHSKVELYRLMPTTP